ncbi:MAG: histidinol dehydrogenase [Candidatus Omnitrophica bacterium]|nr:histidinol dehydrogenase [Candidatus Omnitrophota bacterium]
MKILTQTGKSLLDIYNRDSQVHKKSVSDKVRQIIEDVRLDGDEAVLKYTKKFDGVKLTAKDLRVPEGEISAAFQNITNDFVDNLKMIIKNVTTFYKTQRQRPCFVKADEGVILKETIQPLESVGIYIPAGTAPLVSTVYMTVIPAKVAGVKRIVIMTPPNKNGQVNPYVLAVANLLKVNEIYKVGGAQAIAALALGTKTVPRVHKVVGPGNIYVTEAKRQVFGFVDIDMLAGPSELAIIANRCSNPDFVAADMEGQIEHLGGLAVLISTSKQLLKQLRNRVPSGYGVYAKNMDEAIEIANKIAPEHLEIMTNNPNVIAKKIVNAGAIFLGPYSPTALGDYAAGPSHVLPTMGSAKYFSGLGTDHFVKKSHVISYSKKALDKVKDAIIQIATLEGLNKHSESIKVRFK